MFYLEDQTCFYELLIKLSSVHLFNLNYIVARCKSLRSHK